MSDYTDEISRVFGETRKIVQEAAVGDVDKEALSHLVFQNLSRSIEGGLLVVSRQIEGLPAREPS